MELLLVKKLLKSLSTEPLLILLHVFLHKVTECLLFPFHVEALKNNLKIWGHSKTVNNLIFNPGLKKKATIYRT